MILKITRKKVKKPNTEANGGGGEPGPDDDGEYEVSWILIRQPQHFLTLFWIFQVEAIIDHKKEKGKTLYRVKWKGYPASQDSWLTGNDLSCKEMLKKYKKKIERDTKDVYVVSFECFSLLLLLFLL